MTINRLSVIKYGLVGITGACIYFLLYKALTIIGSSAAIAVITAGTLCILLNSYGHARFSFERKYTFKFARTYILIQFICLVLISLLAKILEINSMNINLIGLATTLGWFVLSYILCMVYVK